MVGIYHSRDLDGFTSGAIIKKAYPDAKLIGFDYGQELPMDQMVKGEPVIMADVSMPMDQMVKLAEHSGWQLTWIDHHISAINEFNEFTRNSESFCTAVLENGKAACEIAWKYLFNKEIPIAVSLLGEYDTWRNQDAERWNNVVMPFQYGMREVCNSPETFPIRLLFNAESIADSPMVAILNNGAAILSYLKTNNALLCKRGAFTCDFMTYRVICLNIPGGNSQIFESVYDESKHDIMMPFFFNGKEWVYSMYTTKEDVDCSMLAKQNGGGGHKKAAGFQSKEFILFSASKRE